jgi:hypothetical protein
MSNLPRLSFDTSAISGHKGLLKNRDCVPLLAGIQTGYFTRLTFPSGDVPVAAPVEATRNALFEILNKLLRNGECLQALNWLAARLIHNYERHGNSRWDSQDVRFRACEDAIARREFSQSEADEQRKFAAETKDQFAGVFADPRPKFDKLFVDGTSRPSSADELLARLNGSGGAFWHIGAGLYQRACGRLPTEEQIRAFAADCPPFFALMIAMAHAQFEWTIRENQIKKSKRVSRVDLFCSIYLPYCDIYVTDDDEQRRCLIEIAAAAKLPVEIIPSADFNSRLMPLAHLSVGA